MAFDGWQAFFAMGGYARYVWGSFAMTALAIGIEVLALRRRARRGAL